MIQINNIANSQYAKEASNYIKILNELRRAGAHFAVNLPTIVFCGNQSAGKSSLLEAISGVKLPKSDGVCTRCVMELRLIESPEACSIDDPDKVELMARRAQKALLNPITDSNKYINWNFKDEDDSQLNSLKFTKNIVCIEIKGSDVPNLSLIDLPGIIRKRACEYIKDDKSIIIVTISCKDEIDNQAIITLAKESDPLGVRTLGVLSKPGMIEKGTHNIWLKIMGDEAHQLELGYYVVKNPTKVQQEPWDSFYLRERIGVKNLQNKLSELLIKFIKRGLPSIRNDVEEKLDETLGKLPMQLSDPRIELFRMIRNCSTIIKEKTTCSNNQNEFWKSLNDQFVQFKKEFCALHPVFLIGRNVKEKTWDRNINIWDKRDACNATFDILNDFIEDHKSNTSKDQLQQITEDQVNEIIRNARGRLLPGSIPYSAAQTIIKEIQIKWKKPAINCLNVIYEIMIKSVNEDIGNTFSRFPGLVERMEYKAQTWLEDCKKQTIDHIDFMYKMERTTYPFTLDNQMMTKLKPKYLNSLHEAVINYNQDPTDILEVVALVMAYLKIAIKRYIDVISMTIIHTFIDEFSERFEEKLMEIVINDKDGSIYELIKEDDNTKYQRERLLNREKLLREVLNKLVNFGVCYK
ncbi:P-loop containing nucleoside triphosphate hydrolase protein [Gigaspora rosea]|uniref:P-loop containing nucleoside triphosphate hydrolase protein n=1 Tax=Gigaspora rosea TaxID=44941 RepID=A0A397VB38_9GLOM|nr:P-loop containing nucleoside triphosphate hydrolase protein [Gigaspora rosea]